jgi:hypothetical protein
MSGKQIFTPDFKIEGAGLNPLLLLNLRPESGLLYDSSPVNFSDFLFVNFDIHIALIYKNLDGELLTVA